MLHASYNINEQNFFYIDSTPDAPCTIQIWEIWNWFMGRNKVYELVPDTNCLLNFIIILLCELVPLRTCGYNFIRIQ